MSKYDASTMYKNTARVKAGKVGMEHEEVKQVQRMSLSVMLMVAVVIIAVLLLGLPFAIDSMFDQQYIK